MEKICLFGLNGTLIDQSSLDSYFAETFDAPQMRSVWSRTVQHLSLVYNVTNAYQEHQVIGESVLESLAIENQVELTSARRELFRELLLEMPLYPDVAETLEYLRANNYRLGVVTNSGYRAAMMVLGRAGVDHHFERVATADTVRRAKPYAEVYQNAAREMEAPLRKAWLVTAHAWDATGAGRAGAKTALVSRGPGAGLAGLPAPDVGGRSLFETAEQLVHRDHSMVGKLLEMF